MEKHSLRARLVAIACTAILFCSSVYAQTLLSTIRGTVTDATGAVAVNVQVMVTDVKTDHKVRTVVSDANGNYEVPDVVAGVYKITAEAVGFKSYIADNVVVEGSQIRRVDIRLEVGQVAESVTVQANAATITTDSAQITGGFKRPLYDESPLVRNYYPHSLLVTLAGVESQGGGWNLTINGQPPSQVGLGMDGITTDGTVNLVNRLDFSEITVTGVSNTADQARVANYNMISKRGENGYHGEAYFTFFNSALNARNFFDPQKPAYKEDRGQLAVSGPIIKNKTFFYVSYFYLKIPAGSYYQRSVPSLKMRAGDLSQFKQAVKDPLSGLPFPNNQIPADRINSTSLKIQDNLLPKPNLGGPDDLVNNYGFLHPFWSDLIEARYPQVRIDHNFSQKNSIFGRWIRRRTPYVLVGSFPNFQWTRFRSHNNWVVTDTHVFSPRVVNTARWGLLSDYIEDGNDIQGRQPLKADQVIADIGLQGVNQPGFKNIQGAPNVSITGFTGFSLPGGGVVQDNHQYAYADSLTWSIGRHVFKFGGEFKTVQQFVGNKPDPTFGQFAFTGVLTGVPYADFLLGLPYTSARLSPLVNRNLRAKELGLYAMDTFKITSKLSLDYGIRWDYFTSPFYDDGLQYAWDPKTGNVVVPQNALNKISPLYPKNIAVVAGNVLPTPDKDNIRPRLGFAYRLRATTVVRGGYGVFTQQNGYFSFLQGGGPFQISETYINGVQNNAPLFSFPNPFPSSVASAVIPSQSVTGFPTNTDNGVIHQFNLTLEQQIGNLGFRLSYIGSRSRGLTYALGINKPAPSLVTFVQSARPYPQFIGATMWQSDGSSNYNSLQFEVQRKVGSLITFDGHYTLQSNLSDFFNLENPYSHHLWNPDAYTTRHRAVITSTIDFPFGKGKRFLSDTPGAVNQIVDGWRLTTVSQFTSGQFFSPSFSGSDPSNTNTVGGLPDRICNGNLSKGDRTIAEWFNPACFAVPPAGRFGNSGVNILKGPGYNLHHISVTKEFKLNERFKLEYVASISNVFNHATFAPPISNISVPGTGRITNIQFGADLAIDGSRAREMGMTLRLTW